MNLKAATINIQSSYFNFESYDLYDFTASAFKSSQ